MSESINVYNKDKIIKISVFDSTLEKNIIWKKQLKLLFLEIREEGYYSTFLSDMYYGKNIPKNHLLIDGKLYVKPKVDLYFGHSIFKTKYFDSYEDAIFYKDQLTSIGRWIK